MFAMPISAQGLPLRQPTPPCMVGTRDDRKGRPYAKGSILISHSRYNGFSGAAAPIASPGGGAPRSESKIQ